MREEQEYEVIRNVCRASIELCKILEAEAFAENEARVTVRNIKRLRLESGLSNSDLARLMGVQKETVLENAHGTTTPRPETLKLYADVFTDRLDRRVSVAEIRGDTDV